MKTPDLANGAVTATKLARGVGGQTGPQGPAGPQGQTGLQGEPGWKDDCSTDDPADVMVKVGSVCIDRYEVSVWSQPSGGTQYGAGSDNYPCNDNGQNCTNIYARSVAGVTPSTVITYFQAQQALANSQKRLPSNAEWQMAVAGTPDSTACNVSPGSVVNTGANAACISNHGANDMVGNLSEWVGDWVPASTTACPGWSTFSDDQMCLSGASTTATGPGALIRGNVVFSGGTGAGPFAVNGSYQPSYSSSYIGFRGAR